MNDFEAESATRVDVRPPAQIHIHQCPDCKKATVQTSKGELEIGTAALAQAHCDCQLDAPGQRNTSAIPPATRRQVLARDRHKCQAPGCSHAHYLEVHHKVPRSRGGTNKQDNLTTLCSTCHRLLHEKDHSGVSESAAVYHWRSCAECANIPANHKLGTGLIPTNQGDQNHGQTRRLVLLPQGLNELQKIAGVSCES